MLIAALLGAASLAQPQGEPCPIVIVENLSILQFDGGSAALSGSVRLTLDYWVRITSIRTYPTHFQLIGNTDRVGSREANRRLSFRRADAVRRYLVSHGVARRQISLTAEGEDNGLVDSEDEVAEPINRVVQFLPIPDEREPQPVLRSCPASQPSR